VSQLKPPINILLRNLDRRICTKDSRQDKVDCRRIYGGQVDERERERTGERYKISSEDM
jgi:hypothetical protein